MGVVDGACNDLDVRDALSIETCPQVSDNRRADVDRIDLPAFADRLRQPHRVETASGPDIRDDGARSDPQRLEHIGYSLISFALCLPHRILSVTAATVARDDGERRHEELRRDEILDSRVGDDAGDAEGAHQWGIDEFHVENATERFADGGDGLVRDLSEIDEGVGLELRRAILRYEVLVSRFRNTHLTVTIVLLVLTLGVACALAWQAHEAARSHREAAERVLQDYVGFAGWEFARAARRELDSVFDRWLQVVNCAASGPLPEPSQLATRDGCQCDDLSARGLFRLDLNSGALETTGEVLDEGSRHAIAAAARPAAALRAIHSARTVRITNVGGRVAIVAARGQYERGEKPAIVGFFAEPAALHEPLTRVIQRTPLLPPTLAGNRSDLVSVGVRTASGFPVVTPRSTEGAAYTGGILDESVGALQFDVWLDGDAAERLVIGGLPRSRLPLLVGLLALTGGLVVAAAFQLRHEHELTRLRSDFVSSVSHELRTPLAHIRLFSETLLLGRVRSETEGRRSLEIIQQESRRLTHLVDNVLYFSRGERGVARLSIAPARLADLASEAIEAFTPLARSSRSELMLGVLDDVVAPVDAGAVRQILLNLIDNAVKYGREGQTVRVTVSAKEGMAVLAVEDGGSGVPEEARARIWQPYCRLSSAAVSAVAGTGIGLAVVRDLTLLHGGSYRVENATSGGARFIVELPGAVHAAPRANEHPEHSEHAVVPHAFRTPA